MSIETRLKKLEIQRDTDGRKDVAVIKQGRYESEKQAYDRHFLEHPEDREAKLHVFIRNFSYETSFISAVALDLPNN